MADAQRHTWELLDVLAQTERRSADEMADDIASPMVDTLTFRMFPADLARTRKMIAVRTSASSGKTSSSRSAGAPTG